MNVLLLSKYDNAGASSRYRTLQYIDYLKERGINVSVNSLLDCYYINKIFSKSKPSIFYTIKQYTKRIVTLLKSKNRYDLCWIEGELFPYIPYFIEKYFLPKNYVAEYDDAIFHNYNMHRNKWVKKLLGKKIDKIMRKSKHVIVGNEYVKQYAIKAGANDVTILPTVVDAYAYIPEDNGYEPKEKVTIGWLGSPTTVKYISMIEPVLKSIANKSNVKLTVIGGEYTLDGIETSYHHWPDKWSEAEEIALLNKIDIGIMPLIDSPWEKGKCGFKLIKYMACGKPVVASPVSSNLEIVTHNSNGYLAHDLPEWESYLLNLVNDAEKRRQYGVRGRQKMLENYSLQATSPVLYEVLVNASK